MRRALAAGTAGLAASVALALPGGAQAKHCGTYLGSKIVTHHVSCHRARQVFRAYKRGSRLPSGWTCGASARACFKGRHTFTFGLY